MISGTKVSRPTKEQMARQIADALGIPDPTMSTGSTVVSGFLDAVNKAITGSATGAADSYRKTECVMQSLGLTYDPYWDTSEAATDGGGTTTTRAYSRILTAVLRRPRCFILNTTDAPDGAKWETERDAVYRYDSTVTGRRSLNDAGPGSRVLHYSTAKSKHDKKKFVSHAEVSYISPGWNGPWEAHLTGYANFYSPVEVAIVDISGWNVRHAITEIPWEIYVEIVNAGGAEPGLDPLRQLADPGGAYVAERVVKEFPALVVSPAALYVPEDLPAGELALQDPEQPTYYEKPDGDLVGSYWAMPSRSASDRQRDKFAEQRAVDLTIASLEKAGWTFTADRQKDGVGYDLEFELNERKLKVEVKGIQGSALHFNMTPKEVWRAETDPEWVVVAVTNVLSPTTYKAHVLDRRQLTAAERSVTGYRLRL